MELIKVGVITNTHGLRGTVKVKSFTDFKEERYKKDNPLLIHFKNDYIPVTVKTFKSVKTLEFIDFNEFKHINDVEKFKGCDLYIKEELTHDLPEDEFYFRELMGLEVRTDKFIGTVSDIREYPQGEYLIVRRDGMKNAIIPFIKEFIDSVDKEKGIIYVKEVEGLL